MDEDFGLNGYKHIESFGQSEKVSIQETTELILFQIAPQFDASLIDGLEVDLNQTEVQIFKIDEQQIGVLVSNPEISSYVAQQIIPVFMSKGLPKISTKPFTRVVKVFQYHDMPEIQKHSIVKLKTITLKTISQKKKQSKRDDKL